MSNIHLAMSSPYAFNGNQEIGFTVQYFSSGLHIHVLYLCIRVAFSLLYVFVCELNECIHLHYLLIECSTNKIVISQRLPQYSEDNLSSIIITPAPSVRKRCHKYTSMFGFLLFNKLSSSTVVSCKTLFYVAFIPDCVSWRVCSITVFICCCGCCLFTCFR